LDGARLPGDFKHAAVALGHDNPKNPARTNNTLAGLFSFFMLNE
jgi:hypothetical protein